MCTDKYDCTGALFVILFDAYPAFRFDNKGTLTSTVTFDIDLTTRAL